MVGGSLSPEWLVSAYRNGIFPWPCETERGMLLAWFSPDPRTVLELDTLHVPRRLERRLRRGEFQFTFDQAFREVMRGCAAPRDDDPRTWITPQMVRAYSKLHQLGLAHSVEVWQDGELVGGAYGVALGGLFAAESMFHRAYDASKAGIVHLARHLRDRGFRVCDIQQWTPHMGRLGAVVIPRDAYLDRLAQAIDLPIQFDSV